MSASIVRQVIRDVVRRRLREVRMEKKMNCGTNEVSALRTRLRLIEGERDAARERIARLEQERDMLSDELRTALVKVAVLERVG